MGKILSVFIFILLASSCGKDIDEFIPRPQTTVPGTIDLLLEKLKSDASGTTTYSLKCPCYGGWTFAIDKDLLINVPLEFVDIDKFPCPKDGYDMKVTIADERGEMLMHGISTISDQTILDSRIQCKIEMQNETGPVQMRDGYAMRIFVRDPDPRDRMELFYPSPSGSWTQWDHDPTSWATVWPSSWTFDIIDSTGEISVESGVGYETTCYYFDWMGISAFSLTAPADRTTVHVQLPQEYNENNTAVYAVMLNYRSIVKLSWDDTSKQFIDPNNSIPVGSGVMFLTLSSFGEGNLQMDVVKNYVEVNHTEILSPLRTPYDEILTFLREL